MPLFYRDLHLRALEAAYHRHYDQLCAVAAAVQGAENAPATVTPVDFGYMPNGFTVTERADPDGK